MSFIGWHGPAPTGFADDVAPDLTVRGGCVCVNAVDPVTSDRLPSRTRGVPPASPKEDAPMPASPERSSLLKTEALEPPPTFFVRVRDAAWVVEDAEHLVGGIFVSREAARTFVGRAAKERGASAAVIDWEDGTREQVSRH